MVLPSTARRFGGVSQTIGLLVDWLEDEYQNEVMHGAVDAAAERQLNLICFCGGVLDSPRTNGKERNPVFELASRQCVNGLLVMGGTLGNHSGPTRLAEYCERYRDLPRTCVGIRLAGTPSVLVDNGAGMREAVEHLLDVHGKRRIFFVRGPAMNEEAESRFAVYRQVLAERGMTTDESLQYIGDFQPSAGRVAMERALDQKLEFDAVVAANDSMAIGALEALKARGVRVPEQVALVGFDDVEEARFLDPPLSTVRQPLYEQGKHAVRLLVAQIQGQQNPADVVLRTQLVVRRSCGCVGSDGLSFDNDMGVSLGFEASMIQKRAIVLADLVRAAKANFGGLKAGWEVRLFNACVDDFARHEPTALFSAYQEALQQVFHSGNPLETWHDVLTTLRRHVLFAMGSDAIARQRAEDIFQQLRIETSNTVERAQAHKRLEAEHLARKMARAGAALIATFDEAALFGACREHLPNLGIQSATLVRYGDEPGLAEVLFHTGHETSTEDFPPFEAERVLPDALFPRRNPFALVIEPLFFRAHSLGYAAFDYGSRNGSLYESLRDQISAALFGARLTRVSQTALSEDR
jgi:DNA-binding LacI/PurR family transcriptional regulator